MCLPSSLLKAGSQLHSSRDSKEGEGPSLARSKAEPCWPPAWRGLSAGADAGRRAEGVRRGSPPLPDSPHKLRPEESLTVEGSSRRAMTEEPAAPQQSS